MKVFFQIVRITLLILLLLEFGVRVSGKYKTYAESAGHGFRTYYNKTYPSWFHRYKSNTSFQSRFSEFSYQYNTNSLGFREREPVWNNDQNIRLATFGDSHTDGIGADYNESWPRRLEEHLQGRSADSEVLIFCRSGADPFYNYIELKETVVDLKPSHVTFLINDTDLEDYIYRGGMERFQPDSTVITQKGPSFLFWYRISHVARFVVHDLMDYNVDLILESEEDEVELEARDALLDCLQKVDDLCRENGIKFLALFMPEVDQVCVDRQVRTKMENLFNGDHSFNSIDLSDGLRAYFSEISDCAAYDFFWTKDGHLKAKGYQLLADVIFNVINRDMPEFWELPSTPNSKIEEPINNLKP